MAADRQALLKRIYEDPERGFFGGQEETFRAARRVDKDVTRDDVRRFLAARIERKDRPQRGYNSWVAPEPMHQLQVALADMGVFAKGPYPHMLVAVDTFTKKVSAVPMKDK